MGRIFKRLIDLRIPRRKSVFLWGPRRVGKSFWIRQTFPEAPLIDLLQSDVFAEYASRPALLRERYRTRTPPLIVIDEITARDAQFVHIGRPHDQVVPVSFFGLREVDRMTEY